MFSQGNTYSKGRPLGAKNLLPNRQTAIELIDTIVKDINTNYEQLDIEHKLRILTPSDIYLLRMRIFPLRYLTMKSE
jgi:hypothetical protein